MTQVCQQIHDATVQILEKTGVRFHHQDAVDVFKDHGFKVDGDIVFITEDQLMDAVKQAPSKVPVRALNPRYDLVFGDGKTYLGPAAGPVSIVELDGSRRQSTFADCVKAIKLFEGNPRFSINGGVPCYPKEVPPEVEPVFAEYMGLVSSDKVHFQRTGSYAQVEAMMDILAAAWGVAKEDLVDNPLCFNNVNVNSPLQFDRNMTETLFTCLKYRQPIAIASAAMGGSTAPVTVEGEIAQVNAEVMSVVTLAQIYAPGAPVLYGSQSASADMKTLSIAIGSPESALCYKYAALLADFYDIPCRGGGSLSDAKVLDAQAGFESLLTYLACKQSGMEVCMQGAGVLNGYLDLSFEKIVCDFEIIDFVDKYLGDLEVDEETVPLETIDEVGQSGSYVMEDHTLDNYTEALLTPKLAARGTVPSDAFITHVEERVKKLEADYKRPERDPERIDAMRAALVASGIDGKYADMLEDELNK